MDKGTLFSLIFTAIGLGFGFFKLKPERDSVIADAAESAVSAIHSALEQTQLALREAQLEVERLRSLVHALTLQLEEQRALYAELIKDTQGQHD